MTRAGDFLGDDRDRTWARLCAARIAYERQVAAAYDEADTPWARQLSSMPDVEVRTVTARAVEAVPDTSASAPEAARLGRRLLSPLPGFTTGDALAPQCWWPPPKTGWRSTTNEPSAA